MALKLITAPLVYPVSRDEAKDHLREDADDFDELIDAMIAAATSDSEAFTGRAFVPQTWDYYLDQFPCVLPSLRLHRQYALQIEIPKPPLISVTGVYYLDAASVEQTLAAAQYIVDTVSAPGRVVPVSSWPTLSDCRPNSVRIRFQAGYDDGNSPQGADAVDESIKAAIKLKVGDLYANRETMIVGSAAAAVKLPWAAEQLLRPFRVESAIG